MASLWTSLTSKALREDRRGPWNNSQLKTHRSFHGDMSKSAAEGLLKQHRGDKCYLTRLNDDCKISVKYFSKDEIKIKHLTIETSNRDRNKFCIKNAESSRLFGNVPELLEYYEKEPVDNKILKLGECLEPGAVAEQGSTEKDHSPWEIIKEHASFHGNLGPSDATARLKEHNSGNTNCYLTRQYFGDYMISVKDVESNTVQHFRIKKVEMGRRKYKFRVRGANDDELFDDVASLLDCYKDKQVYRGAPSLGECLRRGAYTRQSTREKDENPWDHLSRLKSHSSYHGDMGPRDAAALLKAHAGGTCYLTRHYWGDYMLSVKSSKDEVQHFKLKCEFIEGQSRFSVKQAKEAMEFTNVPELLEHYKFNAINDDVTSIGDCLEPEISYVYTAPSVQNEITYPTRANLFMLKWTDTEGKVQRLRIFHELSKKWEDIGILLGLSWSELEEVKSNGCGDDVRCCQLVFKEYLSGKYTQHYPKTWDGLYELMQDVEFEELADKLKEILASKHIFV